MKVAIVHEMLIKMGGAEKVVQSLSDLFPDAPIYTSMYDEKKLKNHFKDKKIITGKKSQKIYNLTKKQRLAFSYIANDFQNMDFGYFDVVIISNSGFAHSIITKPETKSIVYYHSPARYLRDRTFEYIREIGWNKGIKSFIIKKFFHKARINDFIYSQRHDVILANSKNVQKRIKKYYRLDSKVIYPPVEVSRFQKEVKNIYNLPITNYYIIVSALSEFKKIEVAINAFNKLDSNLVIVGDGNHRQFLEKLSNKEGYYSKDNSNIFFTGAKYDEELVFLVQNANGLIFPGEEDFGIVPIEALGAGIPVFALYAGGLGETIKKGISGEFFYKADGSDFIENFKTFEKNIKDGKYNKEVLQKEASKYDNKRFMDEIEKLIND